MAPKAKARNSSASSTRAGAYLRKSSGKPPRTRRTSSTRKSTNLLIPRNRRNSRSMDSEERLLNEGGREDSAASVSSKKSWITGVHIVLGLSICANYTWGVMRLNSVFPETGALLLWGPIVPPLLYVYYFSIMMAAITYCINLYVIWDREVLKRFSTKEFYNAEYSLIVFFVFSHGWLPLCVWYLETASESGAADAVMYNYLLVAQLGGAGLCGLAWAYFTILGMKLPEPGLLSQLGKYGPLWFALHCLILDGVVWNYYFWGFQPSEKMVV